MADLISAMMQTSKPQPQVHRYLSTGLTLLNLLLSGESSYGIESGSVVWVTGPSDSGRTTIGLTFLAETHYNKTFDNYDVFYTNTEGQKVSIGDYFGGTVSSRITQRKVPNIETFWQTAYSHKKPFVWVLDSMDGLMTSEAWVTNNENAKRVFDRVRDQGSILIITSQEKNVSGKKVASGGFAIPFYADYAIMTNFPTDITKRINNKERIIGTHTKISMVKSRGAAYRDILVPAPILFNYGYDNIQSMFSFLVQRKAITYLDDGKKCYFRDFDFTTTHDKMLDYIGHYETVISQWIGVHLWDGPC